MDATAEREAKEVSILKRLRTGETSMQIFGWT
jgi:hypothetical protein